MARPRVAAGALFFDASDRILLVKPTYKDGWDIPGGYVEPGETPLEACHREVKEELGLSLAVGGLLVVDWAPSEREGDKLLFVFDGGRLGADQLAAIVLPSDELSTCEFVPPKDARGRLVDRLERRISRALEARRSGGTFYLEHGDHP